MSEHEESEQVLGGLESASDRQNKHTITELFSFIELLRGVITTKILVHLMMSECFLFSSSIIDHVLLLKMI